MEMTESSPTRFGEILDEPGTNLGAGSLGRVHNLESRKFDILRLENLRKDKLRLGAIFRTSQPVERTSKVMFWSC